MANDKKKIDTISASVEKAIAAEDSINIVQIRPIMTSGYTLQSSSFPAPVWLCFDHTFYYYFTICFLTTSVDSCRMNPMVTAPGMHSHYKHHLPYQEDTMAMKSTGVVRQLDSLGRIVLPIELRRTMDIGVKDMVEIFVEDDRVVLKKYHPACIFCGDARDVASYKGKLVCKTCLNELAKGKIKD